MSFFERNRLTPHETSFLKLTAVLLPTTGWVLSSSEAIAQTSVTLDSNTGQVQVDRNAIDVRTGPLGNSSNIPLPAELPSSTRPRFSQPVDTNRLAPNSIEITPDVDYIERELNQQLQQSGEVENYTIDEATLQVTSEFKIERRPGTHGFGEGIEATVIDAAGDLRGEPSTAFVRGDGIRIGPDGQPLPNENQLSVTYGAGETARIRFLNLRRNNNPARESGVYFTESGEIIVEDLQNGGDLDFDDGEYLESLEGEAEVGATRTRTNTTQRTEVEETQLEPERREEEFSVGAEDEDLQVLESPQPEQDIEEIQADAVAEIITDWGKIEISQPANAQIGHGTGARTQAGEQLVYDRYAPASGQVRAGSDGITLAGQLSPIINSPDRSPTFMTGSLTFNPSAGNNEAGLVGTARLTHFLAPTHRAATDMYGARIENPEPEGVSLLEPAGWGSNRRLVGYVPPTIGISAEENALTSRDGVFQLPADQAIKITPSAAPNVGQGDSAYRRNVGGLLIERSDGSFAFMPQWTEDGHESESMLLSAGEATRIIYALVPQQPGQTLRIGETYTVERSSRGYQILEGGFTVIAADDQPQNFYQEQVEVYAVEDTLPGLNTVTPDFNGIQGVYSEVPGGELVPTVDVRQADHVDARVGNQLFTMTNASTEGQKGYYQTTRAGGFYLGGALSLGIGNQEDTIIRTQPTAVAGDRTLRGLRIFETSLTRRDERRIETIETIQSLGMAFFDLNSSGEVENVRFVPGDVINRDGISREIDRTSNIIRGEETLVDTIFDEDIQADSSQVERDEADTVGTDTYPNVSPLQGELAIGMVYNFGNTPWSAAANNVRAELFTRGMAFGQQGDIRVGWRSEVIFYPFGEVRRPAYQYDEAGNTMPVYRTEPVLKADGSPLTESVTTNGGNVIEVAVNQFVTNEEGVRFTETVGTGRAKGPGVYLRLEDVFGDDDSLSVAAGLQLTF